MPRTILLFVLLVALLNTGCSSLTPEPLKTSQPSPQSPKNEWTIKMTHSGGIMGLSRSIEISSDGAYVVTDNVANETITGKLPASELSKLSGIVSDTRFASTAKSLQSGCADCFIYTLETEVNGKNISYQADDTTLKSSGFESLVIYLQDLMDEALR